jgi:hypothetical protein
MREKRLTAIKRQKNFFPALIITILLWFSLVCIILFASPTEPGLLELFFANLFLVLMFTFSLMLGNTRRGLITSLSLTVFAGLRYFGIGNVFNLILILGAAIAFEFYFTKNH